MCNATSISIRASSDPSVDNNGNCIHHPAIKVKRQTSSGNWKTLLSSCPLCSIRGPDPPQRGSSIISSRDGNGFRRRSSNGGRAVVFRSDSSSSSSHDNNRNELRRLSSSNGSRSIVNDRCVGRVGDGYDDDQCNYENDNDDNDRLSPLRSRQVVSISPHDITMSPLLYKPISTLSSAASIDATVASSCSVSSSQQSSDCGAETPRGVDVWWEDELLPQQTSPCQPCAPPRRQSTLQGLEISPPLPLTPSTPYSPLPTTTPSLSRQSSFRRSSSTSTVASPSPTSTSSKKKAVVCGLKYTDPISNKRGSYTGQLNPVTKLPHGIGTLRYTDGSGFCEGKWNQGLLVTNIANDSVDAVASSSSSRGRDSAGRPMSSAGRRISRSKSREKLHKIRERLGRSRSKSRDRRGSSQSVSSEQHRSEIGPELKIPQLCNSGGMVEEVSWCQPCTDVGGDLVEDLKLICAPEPPVVNTQSSGTISRGYQRTSSQGAQDSHGSYNPRQNTNDYRPLHSQGSSGANRAIEVAPPPVLEQHAITAMLPYQNNEDQGDDVKNCNLRQNTNDYRRLHSQGSSVANRVIAVAPPPDLEQHTVKAMVPYQNNQDQDNNVKNCNLRQNTNNYRQLHSQGSSGTNRVIEVTPPPDLEQHTVTAMLPYQNNQDQDDNVKNGKSLETTNCDKSQYISKYSRSRSDLGGGGSRKSVGPYSARASSFCIASSYTLAAATSRRGVDRVKTAS